MKSNNIYTENGNYNHPQFEGGITLKQYIFAKQNHKSCLLFRFINESPYSITSFEFLLTELGTDGKVISRRKIVQSKLNIIPGEMFSPQESFVVSDGCADFRIKLLSYVSIAVEAVNGEVLSDTNSSCYRVKDIGSYALAVCALSFFELLLFSVCANVAIHGYSAKLSIIPIFLYSVLIGAASAVIFICHCNKKNVKVTWNEKQ